MQTHSGPTTGECGTLLIYSFPWEQSGRRPQKNKATKRLKITKPYRNRIEGNQMGYRC